MKRAIRYLRFSKIGQSHHSIEWQDLSTAQYGERNDITYTDTFTDDGHSARTFDRPDFEKLSTFISKNYRTVDYLVVNDMSRFSRDTGEALILIKKLQRQYSIQIISVLEGITFDYNTPGSFFRTGLQLLLAEDENISRTNRINAGIYTAKAKEGRYISSKVPIGYKKDGKGKERGLVIDQDEAPIVRFIFDAYLKNFPFINILEAVKPMGFKKRGHGEIQEILKNPIYSGQQYVKPWKDMPGGLFPAKHEPIIDILTWNQVQAKILGPVKTKVSISDDIPLRGVLKCHCGKLLTGAPSRGKSGKYFFYYKCQVTGHNNLSARRAHEQLEEILQYLSLPEQIVLAMQMKAEELMKIRMQEAKKSLTKKKIELSDTETQLKSVEFKWINNQMNYQTYNRWFSDLSARQAATKGEIERLSQNEDYMYSLLKQNLMRLTDLGLIYQSANTLQKQQLINKVFDNGLYYSKPIYRTPYIMPIFSSNLLILKEKQLLEIDGPGVISGKVERTGIEPVIPP